MKMEAEGTPLWAGCWCGVGGGGWEWEGGRGVGFEEMGGAKGVML